MGNKSIRKIFPLYVIVIFILPTIPLMAITNENDFVLTPQEEYDKLHKGFLYTRGHLTAWIDSDWYHVELEADKDYIIWTKIKIESGGFNLWISGPGGLYAKPAIWDSSATNSERVISFIFHCNAAGDHNVYVGATTSTDGGDYQLYVNRARFANYWWMILIGVVILLLLILVPLLLLTRTKKKKKKKRKGKRK